MADFYGRQLDRVDMLRRTGTISQLAYIRPFEYADGKAKGIKAFEVSNGTGLDFTVLESKCLDIPVLKYKGMNFGYAAKSGIVSPALADGDGTEFMRSIAGGMLYTCGLRNVGTACTDGGLDEPFHGRMRNTPADRAAASCGWDGDEYRLSLSGEMREAAIFNDNLVLKRTISTAAGARHIAVRDSVENQGFAEEELMLLYHVNVGYPVLDDGARLLLPAAGVEGKDDYSAAAAGECAELSGPIDGFAEQVFRIRMKSDFAGMTGAAVVNDRLGIGVYIKYDTNRLPYLVEWKSMRSGDYALGIMPSTGFVNGRAWEREHGTLRKIAPLETLEFGLEIGVLDGAEDILAFEAFLKTLT